MMPKSVKRFSGAIMLYFLDLEADSDFRSIRPEIIRLWPRPSRCRNQRAWDAVVPPFRRL